MMKNPRTIQVAILAVIVLLVGFLFSRDIKGLVKSNDEEPAQMAAEEVQHLTISLDDVTRASKNLISNAATEEFRILEADYRKAKGEDKVKQALTISQKWDDLGQPVPSALYLEEAANAAPNLDNWLKAGSKSLEAYDFTRDTVYKPVMLEKANHAFQKAYDLDSTSLDAKTGLGITIVNGLGAPMEGIAMLLDVVKKDPKNFKAQLNLGIFAIKSGQYDKGIDRLENVVKNIKATPDGYLFLATAYEGLGRNEQAIEAYLNSKKLAANPTLSTFVDKKVAELKK
jgi:predicted Zn-dependent protease